MYRVSILTVSDTRTYENDTSGKFIKEYLSNSFEIKYYEIVKDDIDIIKSKLLQYVNEDNELIITTGGTGLSKRDNTPEATLSVIDKNVPGISEAIRYFSLEKTKNAMLSRGVSGIKRNSLIINLPGSLKAVKEILPYIIEPVIHGIDTLSGKVKHH